MNRPYTPILKRKTSNTNEAFLDVRQRVTEIVPRSWFEHLMDEAVRATRYYAMKYGTPAYAWSGGKDSLALELVMNRARIKQGYISLTPLEYPAQAIWCHSNMPSEIMVWPQQHLNYQWIAEHPEMLFPVDHKHTERWGTITYRAAREGYQKVMRPGVLFDGRRRADGNVCPANPKPTKSGRLSYYPLADWTHEDVMAAIAYGGMEWPPIYDYPHGFLRGTGPWPYVYPHPSDTTNGWKRVYTCDSRVVVKAAQVIPSAAAYLRGQSC